MPTRSAAENKKLKEENEKLKREIAQLKSDDASDESEEEPRNKKAKATKKKAKAKVLETGVWAELKKALKEKEYNDIKFLHSESDEHQLMKACLQSTNQWPRLSELSEEELDDEVQTYVDAYGSKLCGEMNRTRGTHQSSLRKVWCENRKKELADPLNNDLTDPAQKLLRVARREPKYLLILPEDTGNKDQDAKNKQLNKENKKYRDRFRRLVCQYAPKCLHRGVWTPKDMTKYLVSSVVPSAAEAMAIVLVMNNEPKWIWQCPVELAYGQVGKYFEKLVEEGRDMDKLEENEKEPLPLFSDSHCGNKKYGGWSVEGKARYMEIKQMVEDARAKETTKEIEEQLRLELLRELEEANKTSEDEEESAAESDDDSQDDGDDVDPKGYESCDSAVVMSKLLQTEWVEKKPAATSTGNDKPAATSTGNGDASSSEATTSSKSNNNGGSSSSEATTSSSNKEDDASSNNNNNEENKEDQPLKPPQQQDAAPPPKPQAQHVPPPVEEKEEEKEEEDDGGAEATDNKSKKKKASKTPVAPRLRCIILN